MDNDKLSKQLLLYVHCEIDKRAAEPSYKESVGSGQKSDSRTSSTN